MLNEEYVKCPDEDNFNIFCEIATDMPSVENEKAMEIWYPNVFSYLEYVYAQCQDVSDDRNLFKCELAERYRALGHAYWYLVYDKQHALLCYNRWKELLDEDNEQLGTVLMHLAHIYFVDDPIKAKSLYEQAIVELAITEEICCVELAVCYARLRCLQQRKRFFIRCFYLLMYIADLSTLQRENLEDVGECYFYLAKTYTAEESIIDKLTARQLCEQALRLFLNVKLPTSNFRDMHDCIEFLLTLQEDDSKNDCFYRDKMANKNELLEGIYNQVSITEEQLKEMLDQTLNKFLN